ncbi:hypothetical protein [uncultured Bosea sp.]|uniref:hypothetical protein n=1 Tax=uncultured Bosea sp. TaxID=211457 RepID=UPI0025D15286|nr:hypothetical protein [uncultured Bosea sp.]
MGVLTSSYFRDSERLQKCAVDHKYHVTIGERGNHVQRLQLYLQDWFNFMASSANVPAIPEGYNAQGGILTFEGSLTAFLYSTRTWEFGVYNRSFEDAVFYYKAIMKYYSLIRSAKGLNVDGIVGVMTIRNMDEFAHGFPTSPPPNAELSKAASPTMRIAATVGSRHILGRLKRG